jgi:hypothetical protein
MPGRTVIGRAYTANGQDAVDEKGRAQRAVAAQHVIQESILLEGLEIVVLVQKEGLQQVAKEGVVGRNGGPLGGRHGTEPRVGDGGGVDGRQVLGMNPLIVGAPGRGRRRGVRRGVRRGRRLQQGRAPDIGPLVDHGLQIGVVRCLQSHGHGRPVRKVVAEPRLGLQLDLEHDVRGGDLAHDACGVDTGADAAKDVGGLTLGTNLESPKDVERSRVGVLELVEAATKGVLGGLLEDAGEVPLAASSALWLGAVALALARPTCVTGDGNLLPPAGGDWLVRRIAC